MGGGHIWQEQGKLRGPVSPKDVKAALETSGLTIHWMPGWAGVWGTWPSQAQAECGPHRSIGRCVSWTCWVPTVMSAARPAWRSAAP